MPVWIIFLRGVNVGGARKLPMAQLRKVLADAASGDVKTYIQSGNIVLRTNIESRDEVTATVADVIDRNFGFRPGTIAINERELAAALTANPYSDAEPKSVHLFFMANEPAAPHLESLRAFATSEEFTLSGTVFYLHAPDGIGRSKLAANVEKLLGEPATARNLNTVNKLSTLAQGGE